MANRLRLLELAPLETVEDIVSILLDDSSLSEADERALMLLFESAPTLAAVTALLGKSSPEDCLDLVLARTAPYLARNQVRLDELALSLNEYAAEASWASSVLDEERESVEPEPKASVAPSEFTASAVRFNGATRVVALARALFQEARNGSAACAIKLRELTMDLRGSPLRMVANFAQAYEGDDFVRGAGLALALLPADELEELEADPRGWRAAVANALEPHRSALVNLGVWPIVSSRNVGLMPAAGADDARQLKLVLEPVVSGGLPGTPVRGRLAWTELQPILSYAIDARALQLSNGLANLTLRAARTPANAVGAKWSDWVLEGVLSKVVAADPMGFISLSAPLTESPVVPTAMMEARPAVEEWISELTLDVHRAKERDA